MTWLWRALPKSLRARSDRTAWGAGIFLEHRETRLIEDLVQTDLDEVRQEKKQAAELGLKAPLSMP